MPSEPTRLRPWLGCVLLALTLAGSVATRITFPLRDPNFRGASAAALLRTDPALLFHVTERIVEDGGAFPADLRASRDMEWPETTDYAAIETVGQELVIAWSYLAFGKPMALHLWALIVMSLWASLVALGVWGVARELTGDAIWAGIAALLWAAMLGDYRTLGTCFIREDFAFPWIALHFWAALRLARTQSRSAAVAAGLTALAAAATWHASLFVLLMEALCLAAWFVRSGTNPFASQRTWLAVALVALGSLAIPVLRAKLFVLSPPLILAYALCYLGWVARKGALSRRASLLHFAGAAVFCFGASAAIGAWRGTGGDYSHVFALLIAKLVHFGVPPADPRELDFGARLLWQGPFRTADWHVLWPLYTAGAVATLVGAIVFAPLWHTGRGDGRIAVAVAFAVLAAFAMWMVERTGPLFGLATAPLAVALLARIPSRRLALQLGAAVVLAHGANQVYMHSTYLGPDQRRHAGTRILWYAIPPSGAENQHLMQWLRANVPAGEPIASDYSTSGAILAHTRHPILNQPKYETRRSRELIETYCRAFYQGTPAELRAYLLERRCRYLVVNRPFVGGNASDLGGILPSELPRYRDKACWLTMSQDPREFRNISGFELVYESPAELRNGSYRVYRAL